MILDENATAVEIETLGNELELRTQLHDELLKKKPDYNRIADLEYRLCDWWGKAKLEQILIATIFQKHSPKPRVTKLKTSKTQLSELKSLLNLPRELALINISQCYRHPRHGLEILQQTLLLN